MKNFSKMLISSQEVMDFLRRDLKLQNIYRDIIAQRIVNQVAQEAGQAVDEEEVQRELDNLLYVYRLDHPSELLSWAADHLATLGDVRRRVSEKLLSKKLARYLFLEQAQNQLEHGHQNFEIISVYKILVPYENLAREIFYQIEEEEISFFEAAHVYDLDEGRRLRCGFEGRMQRWQLPPDLTELLSNTAVGEVVGPSRTADGHSMLLLIDELLVPELVPETIDQIIDNLFQDWLANQLAIYFNYPKEDSRRQPSEL
jgi:parvulin-like peptidyl-prolyl isomerase